MKNKLMIALAVLALVFGLVFTACDDGEIAKIKKGDNETIYDAWLLGNGSVDKDGNLQGLVEDTTGAKLPGGGVTVPSFPKNPLHDPQPPLSGPAEDGEESEPSDSEG